MREIKNALREIEMETHHTKSYEIQWKQWLQEAYRL